MDELDYFYFDCETRSPVDLKKVGRANYFSHPKTEVTLISWAVNNGPIEQWAIGDEIPESLLSIIERKDDKLIKVAHNIGFDITALHYFVTKLERDLHDNWYEPSTYVDTMAIGAYYRVGFSLDRICTVLGEDVKQIHGKAIMNKQCKPDRKGRFPVELNEEEMKHFKEYGKHDVRMCRMIHQRFDPLPLHERKIWEWTYRNNKDGILVDKELLLLMSQVLKDDAAKLLPEFKEIMGDIKVGSPKLKDYFKLYFDYCDNMQKHTVQKMLNDKKEVPAGVRRALKIKSMLGSTSVKKVFRTQELMYNNVIKDTLSYHQAVTKRWSGRDENAPGIQIQNFPRSSYSSKDIHPEHPDFLTDAQVLYDVGALDSNWVKNNLRRIFKTEKGNHIHCADYSRIEPVVIFWLSGMGSIPDKWYEAMASEIFNKSIDEIGKDSYERHIGKFAALSCGYGISANGFMIKADEAGTQVDENLAKRCVNRYRERHSRVQRQWNIFWEAYKVCLRSGREVKVCNDMVKFKRLNGLTVGTVDMEITLPSGGKIYHRKVKFEMKDNKHSIPPVDRRMGMLKNEVVTYLTATKGRKILWHGALMEHICSGTARELMASALLRLEREGYRVINTIHDELWVEASAGDHIQKEIKRLMEMKPMWAKGLNELKVEIESGSRYLK